MDALINLKDCKEYMTITLGGLEHQIKLGGTVDTPYFCGKDACRVLGNKDPKDALQRYVDYEDKISLQELKKVEGSVPPTFFLGKRYNNLSHNDGRAVYISEGGLYSLLNANNGPNKQKFKMSVDQFVYNIRYKRGMKDLFTFIMDKKTAIDIESEWFQELWYPLSKKRGVLGSTPLLEWLGYEGETKYKQRNFKKLLDNNGIPYEEIAHDDCRFLEHPTMKRELEHINQGNITQKRWLVLETRDFKKAVMRLNTKNAEMIRDYYLNLEESCFEYAEYQANWLREKAEAERTMKVDQLTVAMEQLALRDKSQEELHKQLALRDKSQEECALQKKRPKEK
jgi:prophage antirepressor-like protein